jgi:acyl-CoA thioesterase FadM
MYPVTRLLLTFVKAKYRKKLAVYDTSELSFICRPWDLDMFFEMNNGRILTLYDLGRFDLSIRCGFIKALARRRWGLAVAGSTIQYRKRIRLFQRVTIKTRIASYDEKWIFVEQSMWVGDKPCSAVMLRTCVTSREGVVPTKEILNEMNISDQDKQQLQKPLRDWATEWIAADKKRPWPPE